MRFMAKNICIEKDGKTYWISRSVAVACFVFALVNGKWCILTNQRGENTPDFQGYWNCPCGYLDYDETTEEAAVREVYEETGVKLKNIMFFDFNDSPSSNKQNVVFYYYSILLETPSVNLNSASRGGEENEVSEIKWIPLNEINCYNWAFDHDIKINILKKCYESIFNSIRNNI